MDEYEKYLNKAVRFLSIRPRSEKEMREYLAKKNTPEQITEKIIAFFIEKKFLNDEEFARMWVRNRTTLKPKSKRIIKLELLQKGIDSDTIEQVLAGEDDEKAVSDIDQARKLARSRLPRYKSLTRQELYQKLGGYLARKGFSWEVIKKSIDLELEREK